MSETGREKPFVVLSGPSGVGKSTIVKEILSVYGPKMMGTTVSYTTRPRRGTERDSHSYYFVSEEKFLSLRDKNFFAEWACVYQNHYGTSIEQIEQHWREGRAIIKDFDLQGANAIKKLYPQTLRVFITPPSLEELANRVHKRKENNTADMMVRIREAKKEMEKISEFDYHLENADLQDTIKKLKKIIEEYLKLGQDYQDS